MLMVKKKEESKTPAELRSMTTLPELPKDSVEEILCRVPATNLKRLRCTSNRWNRLFKDDERFAREHCDKAAKEVLALMLTENYRISPMSVNLNGDVPSVEVKSELSLPDPRFNSNSYQFYIDRVFHCDGLLLCTHDGRSQYGSKIVVWNPFTGQARWIEAKGVRFVLGYSKRSCRKSYKILNFCRGTSHSEIYDFDSDSWKLVDHDIAPGWTINYSSCRSVSFKGDIYWIAKQGPAKDLSTNNISLLRFDFSTEKSQGLPLPYERVSYEVASLSAVREDKLSALLQCDRSSKTEIWVTNQIDDTTTKGGAVSWTKVLALDLSIDLQMTDYGSFLLDEEKKIVVWLERWLDLKDDTKSIDKIYIVGEDSLVTPLDFGVDTHSEGWPVIFNYVPSFVQVERAQIKRAGDKRKRGE